MDRRHAARVPHEVAKSSIQGETRAVPTYCVVDGTASSSLSVSNEAPTIVQNTRPTRAGSIVALTGLAIASAIAVLGWITGLRHVMHAVLLAAGLAAFLPFVLLAGVAAALLSVGIVLALAAAASGGDVGPDGVGGQGVVAVAQDGGGLVSRCTRGYYRFLGRREHPAWLGVALGLPLGALLCWTLLAIFVIPVEARTIEGLLQAQLRLDAEKARTGRYPSPDDAGQLVLGSETAMDAFGRPLQYRLQGKWKAQSYRLVSLGADGREGGDDLCVSRKSRLAGLAARIVEPLAALESLHGRSATWSSKFAALQSADCKQ